MLAKCLFLLLYYILGQMRTVMETKCSTSQTTNSVITIAWLSVHVLYMFNYYFLNLFQTRFQHLRYLELGFPRVFTVIISLLTLDKKVGIANMTYMHSSGNYQVSTTQFSSKELRTNPWPQLACFLLPSYVSSQCHHEILVCSQGNYC